jgi:hypothetical protein
MVDHVSAGVDGAPEPAHGLQASRGEDDEARLPGFYVIPDDDPEGPLPEMIW